MAGRSFPLGATLVTGGANFSIFSRTATSIDLLFFDGADDARPSRVIPMLSVGVPMFVMGDEVRRTRRGNNNAYCQDNDTGWFDRNLLSKHADVLRFVK